MKTKRQEIILEIVNGNGIETQEQLLKELSDRGITTTQATLSRDIKALKLIKKITDNGKSVYVSDNHEQINDDELASLMTIFKECVRSYDIAQNIIVLKTLPGLASAACSALDNMKLESLVGTIAGDDTAFLLFRDINYAMLFLEEINSIINR